MGTWARVSTPRLADTHQETRDCHCHRKSDGPGHAAAKGGSCRAQYPGGQKGELEGYHREGKGKKQETTKGKESAKKSEKQKKGSERQKQPVSSHAEAEPVTLELSRR